MKVCFCWLFVLTGLSAELVKFAHISVTGRAEMKVKPDEAEIAFEVLAHGKEAAEAMEKLEERTLGVLKLLKEQGIEEKAVESASVRKRAVRRTQERRQLEILGYDCEQGFTVKLEGLEMFAGVMQGLLKLEGVQGIRSSFDVSTREEEELKLVQLACLDAKKQAENLALGMSVKLGPVFAMQTGQGYGPDGVRSLPLLMAAEGGGQDLFFVPDTIELSQAVGAIFRIAAGNSD
ncbi:MAG: SIMPL domain-containing protein [Verrucomicrobiota bacterium]